MNRGKEKKDWCKRIMDGRENEQGMKKFEIIFIHTGRCNIAKFNMHIEMIDIIVTLILSLMDCSKELYYCYSICILQ